MDFTTKINKLLKLKGLTQRDIVRALGDINKDTVSRWFTGKAFPRLDEAYLLAQQLDCSVDFLADDSQENLEARGLMDFAEQALIELGREVGFENLFSPQRANPTDEEPDPEVTLLERQVRYSNIQSRVFKEIAERQSKNGDNSLLIKAERYAEITEAMGKRALEALEHVKKSERAHKEREKELISLLREAAERIKKDRGIKDDDEIAVKETQEGQA